MAVRSLIFSLSALLVLHYSVVSASQRDFSVPSIFYPFGVDEGDSVVSPGDDNCDGPTYLPSEVFGSSKVYICTNGLLSFDKATTAKSGTIPTALGESAFIAPFWVDLSTSYANDDEQGVYYRFTSFNVTLFTQARQDAQQAFIGEQFCSFEAEWMFIATWYQVPHGDLASKDSTFQVVLISDTTNDFIMFNYAHLQYSDSPVAGYDAADRKTYHALPGYKNYDIINLVRNSNIGVTGRWMYRTASLTARFAGGNLLMEGRVEIYHDNVWGTICEEGFDDVDASVVCHSLGFRRRGTSESTKYGPGEGDVWLSNIQCYGNETVIEQCPHDDWGDNLCDHSTDVGASCLQPLQPPINDFLRLAGSQLTYEGRLEVLHSNGTWGTVCDDLFTDAAARVACNTMGFGYVGRVKLGTFPPGTGVIWLDDVECTGLESNISECTHKPWGMTGECQHSEDIAITCAEDSPTPVRLVGGDWEGEGRLEVLHGESWGTVCRTGFTDVEAKVVCNSLGYGFFGETEYNS